MKRGVFILTTLAVCLGIAGTVAFFPMKLRCGRTCLADIGECPDAGPTDPGELIDRYVYPYGLMWWVSLLFVFVGAYRIVRRTEKVVEGCIGLNSTE